MTLYLLLLLILLLPTPPSSAKSTMLALDLTPSLGAKLMRRSAGPYRVGIDTKRAAKEIIWLGSRESQKPLIVDSEGNIRVTKQDRLTSDAFFNIQMVLNFSTGQPLVLPGENLTETGEFKFLIRSQVAHFYICMSGDGKVYTMKVQANQLSDDCLWRGRLQFDPLGSAGKQRMTSRVTMVTFNSALNPSSTAAEEELEGGNNGTQRNQANIRWYLSFATDGGAPINARHSHLGGQIRVMAIEEFDTKPLAVNANLDLDSVEVGQAGVVRVEAQSLNAATRQRLIESEVGGRSRVTYVCSAAAQAAAEHSELRWNQSRQVLFQLQLMRNRLRPLVGPAGIRLVNRFLLRDLALGFLDDESAGVVRAVRRQVVQRGKRRRRSFRRRFLCRRDLLTLAFQSFSVARWLIERDCPSMAAGGAKARRQRQRRRDRVRRSLLRLLRRAGGGGATRGGSVLAALRNALNMSLPSKAEIREALLRRRAERKERLRIMAVRPKAGDLTKRLQLLRLEDSVMFAQTVRHSQLDLLLDRQAGASRKQRTKSEAGQRKQQQQLKKKKKKKTRLLTMKQLAKLREKWQTFPKFYQNICSDFYPSH